jgi:hypothetical protein
MMGFFCLLLDFLLVDFERLKEGFQHPNGFHLMTFSWL